MARIRRLAARAIVWLAKPELEARIDQRRMWLPMLFGDADRIKVHPSVVLGNATLNASSGSITIGADAILGQGVTLAAATHDPECLGVERVRAVPTHGYDIVIEHGAWLASNVTVLGPCTIGEHAVVAAGSVVTRDVASHTVVAGIPARPLRKLSGAPRPTAVGSHLKSVGGGGTPHASA